MQDISDHNYGYRRAKFSCGACAPVRVISERVLEKISYNHVGEAMIESFPMDRSLLVKIFNDRINVMVERESISRELDAFEKPILVKEIKNWVIYYECDNFIFFNCHRFNINPALFCGCDIVNLEQENVLQQYLVRESIFRKEMFFAADDAGHFRSKAVSFVHVDINHIVESDVGNVQECNSCSRIRILPYGWPKLNRRLTNEAKIVLFMANLWVTPDSIFATLPIEIIAKIVSMLINHDFSTSIVYHQLEKFSKQYQDILNSGYHKALVKSKPGGDFHENILRMLEAREQQCYDAIFNINVRHQLTNSCAHYALTLWRPRQHSQINANSVRADLPEDQGLVSSSKPDKSDASSILDLQ